MVGTAVAVLVSIEVKGSKGRSSGDQENWMARVQAAGGWAGIARSVDEAKAILSPDTQGLSHERHHAINSRRHKPIR